MDWIQVLAIIGSLGTIMFFVVQRLEKDIDRLDKNIEKLGNRLDGHALRIDQLYLMFVDLVKASGIKPVCEEPTKKSKN